jgi:hypothetical protein
VDRPAFWAALLAGCLTVVGLAAHCVLAAQASDGLGLVAGVLILNNLIVLGLLTMFVVERPRPRLQERFAVNEPASWSAGEGERSCRVIDLSLSGALLQGGPLAAVGAEVELTLEGVGRLAGWVVRHAAGRLGVAWQGVPESTRDRLIRYLYTTERTNDVESPRHWQALRDVLKRTFAPRP